MLSTESKFDELFEGMRCLYNDCTLYFLKCYDYTTVETPRKEGDADPHIMETLMTSLILILNV